MRFEKLQVSNWRQFREIELRFHPSITIVTGANGAGKTTLLNLLGRHFGCNVQFISTGRYTREGAYKYYSGVFEEEELPLVNHRTIGRIVYDNGIETQVAVPDQVSPTFDVHLPGQQPVDGVFLPSHRPVYSFQRVEQIPTQIDANNQLFDRYYNNLRSLYQPRTVVDSPSFQLKASLISLATFGYGNQAVRGNEDAVQTFEGFEKVLSQVLPRTLGFRKLEIRVPDVALVCDTGDFSLDAASGGVAAIVDMAWQLFMKSLLSPTFVAIIDEPENHLHPELQRSVIPGFVSAFPGCQMIIASHNPFVVTSMRDSYVHVLNYVEGRVESVELSNADRSASANKVLTDVLGVPVPIPLWVEEQIASIVTEFESQPLNDATIRVLRRRLDGVGLGHAFPETIGKLASHWETA